MDPYATHQRLLIAAAMQTDGRIVEMGCGDYSTPLLAEIAAAQSRPFVVYTTSKVWGAKYHSVADVRILQSWAEYPYPPRCGLTFLDNEEYVRDRKRHVPRLLATNDVVVCHDMGRNEWAAKYSVADTAHSPPTIALSCHQKIVVCARESVPIVACVYRTGGAYTAEYVERLATGVATHATKPYRFVCFTDSTEKLACETIPLTDDLPGWWSKLEMFKSYMGRMVYFDLDTMIVGNIDPLLDYDGPMLMLRGWYHDNWASGVMAWNSPLGFICPTDDERKAILLRPKAGDQEFIARKLINAKWQIDKAQDILPGITSYKKYCKDGVPEGTRVVCFHGRPRPHEIGWNLC
jgi:hypothetical protein